MIASRKYERLQATAQKYNDRKTSQGHLVPTKCIIRDQDEVKATVEVNIVHFEYLLMNSIIEIRLNYCTIYPITENGI